MLKKLLLIFILLLGAGYVTTYAKSNKNKGKSVFTMWQIPAYIGTNIGNEVEAWFISHPHDDHMGALWEILKDRKGMKINHIYHSRFSPELIDLETPYNEYAHNFYAVLDTVSIPVTDIREPGLTGNIDGFNYKILGVVNEEFHMNPYNNSSMVIKVWDDKKDMLFLGDCGAEAGDKLLNGPYRKDLDCEYVQMAHHGQHGCTEEFYKTIKFRVCLWPTAYWIWTNDFGGGPNSGTLEINETRRWMDEIGIKEHHVYCLEGIYRLD